MASDVTQVTQLVSESEGLPTNWGRWGEHDERGTLNLITAEVRARAVAAALPLAAASGVPVNPLAIL